VYSKPIFEKMIRNKIGYGFYNDLQNNIKSDIEGNDISGSASNIQHICFRKFYSASIFTVYRDCDYACFKQH